MTNGLAEVLVLGLGNMLLGDDGVGPALIGILQADHSRWAGRVEIADGGTQGLALMHLLSERSTVILLDAFKAGKPPGTISVLRNPGLNEIGVKGARTAHESNAGELVALAMLMGDMPKNLVVVGIEPQAIATGIGLSEPVSKSLPAAAEAVRALVEETLAEAAG